MKLRYKIFFAIFLSFFFFSPASAEEKANFGESCTATSNCVSRLTCIGNACVQCGPKKKCSSGLTCEDGACVRKILNLPGDFCANSSQCLSNNCNAKGICEIQAGGIGTEPGKNTGNQEPNPLSKFPGEDLEFGDVTRIIIGLSCWLTRISFTLALIFLFLAGLRFMAAQGNQTKYGDAVKNFRTVLLGILVIYGVYVIIATVAHAVGVTNFSFIPLVC